MISRSFGRHVFLPCVRTIIVFFRCHTLGLIPLLMNTCAPCHCSTQQYGSLLVEDLAPTYVQQVAYLQHCHLVRIPFIIYQKQEVSPRSSHIVVGYHYQNTQCSTGIKTYCYVCGWRLFCIIQDILQTGLEAYKRRTHSPNGTQSHTYIS